MIRHRHSWIDVGMFEERRIECRVCHTVKKDALPLSPKTREVCAVQVWRDIGGGHFRSFRCDRPCKGVRTTSDDVMWPVCGIHLRAKRGMVEREPGRWRALREKGQV